MPRGEVRRLTLRSANQLKFDLLEDLGRHGLLRALEMSQQVTTRRQQFDFCCGCIHGGRCIEYHQITALLFRLRNGAKAMIFGFQSKTDDPAMRFLSAQGCNHVLRFNEAQHQPVTGLRDLLILPRELDDSRTVRLPNDTVTRRKLSLGDLQHLFGADHV